MEYQYIGIAIVVGATIMSFMKPFLELRSLLTSLNERLKALTDLFECFNANNNKDHDTFYKFMHETEARLAVIETTCANRLSKDSDK